MPKNTGDIYAQYRYIVVLHTTNNRCISVDYSRICQQT